MPEAARSASAPWTGERPSPRSNTRNPAAVPADGGVTMKTGKYSADSTAPMARRMTSRTFVGRCNIGSMGASSDGIGGVPGSSQNTRGRKDSRSTSKSVATRCRTSGRCRRHSLPHSGSPGQAASPSPRVSRSWSREGGCTSRTIRTSLRASVLPGTVPVRARPSYAAATAFSMSPTSFGLVRMCR